ncbi:MAG: tetratricopeptide repeat protein, partial [Terriglobales bacterium]
MNPRTKPSRFFLAGVLAVAVLLAALAQPKGLGARQGTKKSPDAAAEAARLNNLGVAYMNQQRFEQGLKLFEQASVLEPGLTAARLNQGIALYNLQRMEAALPVLEEVAQEHPENVSAWFNLGLLHRNRGEAEAAMESFARVARLDPEDADTQYYLGAAATLLEKYEVAATAFERALKSNPFHASAEFGLARAYQRTGQAERAQEHLARFQRITQEKLGAPIGLAYGDQGRYSLAEEVASAAPEAAAAIPVRFVSAARLAGLRFRREDGGGSTIAEPGEQPT